MKGLSKSSVFSPAAYKRLRCGARSIPFLIMSLRIPSLPFYCLRGISYARWKSGSLNIRPKKFFIFFNCCQSYDFWLPRSTLFCQLFWQFWFENLFGNAFIIDFIDFSFFHFLSCSGWTPFFLLVVLAARPFLFLDHACIGRVLTYPKTASFCGFCPFWSRARGWKFSERDVDRWNVQW